jgi:hypothetical protein
MSLVVNRDYLLKWRQSVDLHNDEPLCSLCVTELIFEQRCFVFNGLI